ncbi:hypothetical protein COR50_14325 [Chitinophaga caeni]|uniref:Cyclic nucleotide-binding domain-containing protein n=1 Tax=Chitinophaga caeni TaxID=2029983 RepID=A0A291QWK8_9BACT|nr:Crp/Fnr family transcriptional regulator [Chitinophaga caeni]ATL48243.1 hypothetical protein COR50_14325 [Chitinophaga caeni]
MLSNEKIAHYLELFKDISFVDLQLVFSLAREKRLKAGEKYIDQGAVSQNLAYVKSGLVRTFLITDDGEERTVMLKWEDQFFASYDTILWNRPSRFIYEAYEDTILLESDYKSFMEVIDNQPKFSKAKTFFLQNMLAEALERVESFVLLSPEERYLQLIREKSNLAQRVPSKHLASLLGITPVSLSRIRSRIAHK